TSSAATASSIDWSNASAAVRTADCGESVQCPKERNPIFFTVGTTPPDRQVCRPAPAPSPHPGRWAPQSCGFGGCWGGSCGGGPCGEEPCGGMGCPGDPEPTGGACGEFWGAPWGGPIGAGVPDPPGAGPPGACPTAR